MSFRYSPFVRIGKAAYRKLFPVPTSPYTIGEIEDVCAVNLVPPERLRHFFKKCMQILQELRGGKTGDYLEFGVFNGASISSAYRTQQETDAQDIRFFGFDAFEGLPAESESEDDGVWKKGFYTCSFENMQSCLRKNEVNPDAITWVKGWYKDTLTSSLAEKYNLKPGIVFIDCDTYSSSKTVLDFIAPLIKEPTIICLDDWKLNDLDIKGMGEYKSFNEFLESNPHFIATPLRSYNRKSKTFLVRLK